MKAWRALPERAEKTRQSLKKLADKASDKINEQSHVTNSQGSTASKAQKELEVRTTSSNNSKNLTAYQ